MTSRRPTANGTQRARRASHPRIDYYQAPDVLALIEAKRGPYLPWSTNSGIINSLLLEWKALTDKRAGIKPKPAPRPGIRAPVRAHARDLDRIPTIHAGVAERPACEPARAYESAPRVICGARRHRDGKPCVARAEPGKKRCRFHGGRSTGPRTVEGKARVTANLPKRAKSVDPAIGDNYARGASPND